MREPLLLENGFNGELETFLKSLAGAVGWQPPVILGTRPTTPLQISMTEQRRPCPVGRGRRLSGWSNGRREHQQLAPPDHCPLQAASGGSLMSAKPPFRKTIAMPILDDIDQKMVDELRSVGEDSAKKAQELARNNMRLGFIVRQLFSGTEDSNHMAALLRGYIESSEGAPL